MGSQVLDNKNADRLVCYGLEADRILTVSEWSEENRLLTLAESARPGKFKISLTPYLKEIYDRLGVTDQAREIVFMKSSQIGATEMGNNWLGYTIDIASCMFMYVMPTVELMKKTSKTRIQSMISSTPILRDKVSSSKSRDGNNTILEKYFDGGGMVGVGANSPVGVSSTPVRFAYADEIDRYPSNVNGEGNVLSLIKTRQITFGSTKKTLLTSTPTLAGISAVEQEFNRTGQRYYYVPCPICNEMQVLDFDNLRFFHNDEWKSLKENDTALDINNITDIRYECIECHHPIEHRHKTFMLANGEWRAKFPEKENGLLYGYHINALYSPASMYTWVDLANDFMESINDVPKTISFINTKLGLTYQPEAGDKPDWELLFNRAHNEKNAYKPNIPFKEIVFITAGVDVQADRLEVSIIGWSEGKRTQLIDYRVLPGNTDNDEVWLELEKIVNEKWIREDDMMMELRMMAVDSGYNTTNVYDFVKKFSITKVIAVKGKEKVNSYFMPPKQIEYSKNGKKIGKVKVFILGVDIIKSELYGFLKKQINIDTGEVPLGYCHLLPINNSNYFRGLTAEEYTKVINKKGFTEYVWVKKYERNEPLDTWVYARAAAAVIGMDRWNAERWQREHLNSGTPAPKDGVEVIQGTKPPTQIKKSPFWDRQ